MKSDEYYMKQALKEAEKGKLIDEVPVGAVLVKDGKIIARAHNLKEKHQCSLDHAEMIAIRKASKKLNNWHLDDCTLYVTLEPCPMCAGACIQSRIKKVVYGASDPKSGSLNSCVELFHVKQFNHHPEQEEGILAEETSQVLKDYFKMKRKKRSQEPMSDR